MCCCTVCKVARYKSLYCGKVSGNSERPLIGFLTCGGSGSHLTLPQCMSTAQTGFIGGAWETDSQHAAWEGSDSCQETREEGTSLRGLCCLVVPSQFSEASVQEEGSALHKLVGDLVNSHRLLSLFVIVSPVLLLQINVTEDCPRFYTLSSKPSLGLEINRF